MTAEQGRRVFYTRDDACMRPDAPTSPAADAAPAGDAALADLLANAEGQLRAMTETARDVEMSVAQLADASPAAAVAAQTGLQQLDRLVQSVEAMADFVGALSSKCGPLGAVDAAPALAAVKLGAVRDRLAGREPEPAATADEEEIELF